jgi:hypothetical protein
MISQSLTVKLSDTIYGKNVPTSQGWSFWKQKQEQTPQKSHSGDVTILKGHFIK